MASTLRQAFSLRLHASRLFVRSPGRLPELDGLRALAILWTVAFHALWYVGRAVPPRTYFQIIFAPELVPLWRGHFGVDAFFVLSGFLIGGMLIDERERTGQLAVGRFYVRRLFRLWPALAVAALADALVMRSMPEMLWANLLYVSNFVPVLESAMTWTWSLAIEEQFYLLCPILVLALAGLAPRARLASIGALAAIFVAIGAGVVIAGGFHAIDSEIVLQREIPDWARAFDHLYSKPWMRAGPLFAGVFAAIVHRMPSAMSALSRARVLGSLGLALALVLAWACTDWMLVYAAPRALEVAYLAGHRTAFGICVAYVLLLARSQHPVGRVLSRALSVRALVPIAGLAYAAYLVNPIVTMTLEPVLAPSLLASGVPLVPVLLACDVVVTFAVAFALHVAVERPFMEIRPA
jgi:peptidoglycan/LPS O-acetylase OafA/YrhL